MTMSAWARGRFGEHADDLYRLVPEALREAHELAAAAQAASGTKKMDPYGHTLKNTQHERLVAKAEASLPGIFTVVSPTGASYELLRHSGTRVLLYPWRFATSRADRREDARMRPSGTRRALLAGDAEDSQQLSLSHAELTEQELEDQLADDAAVMDELRSLARVVLVAYASNPTSLLSVGWGEEELTGEAGRLSWSHFESLSLSAAALSASSSSLAGSRFVPRSIGSVSASAPPGPRFDEASLKNDLGLRPRTPSDEEPVVESGPAQPTAGTINGSDGDQP